MSERIRGRFEGPPEEWVSAFVASAAEDIELVPHDLAGAAAHVDMLEAVKLLTRDEAAKLRGGIETLRREGVTPVVSDEDVHMAVEGRLESLVGPLARKLNTGRSRNDQVATDLRLYVRAQAKELAAALYSLSTVLGMKGSNHAMPGYTHLQRAQPVTLATALGAFSQAFLRDAGRFVALDGAVAVCPLGAGALAGSTLPLDPKRTAASLDMKPFTNTIDAVTDRDFAVEFVFDGAMAMLHLSQWAETWILWQSQEFGFVRLPDAICTGSSLMPQKKNPDVVELIRGRCGRVVGALVQLLTTLKGLPPAYNRDLQETKPPVFETARTALSCVAAAHRVVEATEFVFDRMEKAAADPQLRATAIAEQLVLAGIPFRDAHAAVAKAFRGRP